ncbi:ABC transporter permease [Marinoscillum sp.]|uniref:ABC transporter permease n=1 Tax=Marinoscillum sp. TaxID=2024838 RepID=UPI003BAC6DBD
MFRNYLITALRNLKRNKVYTLLNVFGLAMGIGCSLVIYKVISYEFSYDKHHEHYGEIYRVVNENIYPDQVVKGMGTPHPVGPAIQADMSNVKSVVRTNYVYGNQLNVYDGNGEMQKFMIDDGIAFTENSYFEVFTVEWIAGNPQTALTNPQSVVVSASEARKLFKLPEGMEQEALGKLINFNNLKDFKVVGVIEDPKEPTSLPFTYLFDYESQDEVNPYFGGGTSWNSTSSNTNTYFIPGDHFNPTAFNQEMIAFVEKHHGEGRSEDRRYLAQSFSEIHFDQEYGSYTGATSLQFLYALGLIGIFLVLTACINFVNLATAQASNRAKEIGIRKAIGSMTSQLLVQFLSEIALITFFAVVIALAIAEMMFNLLSDIIGYQLSVDLFGNPETFLFLFILFIVVSLLSGFYPAVLLSRMNTVQALKKKITSEAHSGGLSLRKGLVIVQFAISQFLIIGTLIVSSQSDYFLNKDLGFATEAILTTYLPERDLVKMERFRQAMLTSPAIESVTYGLSEPTGNSDSHSNINYAPLESEKDYHANFKPVDPYYTDFFDIEILAGRTVQEGDSNNVVINEKIARLMGFQKGEYDKAIGETLETGWGGNKTVVGVMEDFHTYSLEEDLDFVLLFHYPEAFYSLSFKTPSLASIDEAKAHFESVWNQVYPEYVLDYDFYDQSLAERYEDVQNITALMRIFAVISILIGCLGLYGLVSFIAMNRIKEIGVRKVLGATPLNILTIFSKEVVILMVISFVVTAPLAFYFLNLWLDNFSFRIDIGVSFFVTALITTLVIALLTISHKTIAAALINPAETLKDD